jgi:hypothetical protein
MLRLKTSKSNKVDWGNSSSAEVVNALKKMLPNDKQESVVLVDLSKNAE